MAEGGKNDMERVGLFSEPGYHTIGDRYPKVKLFFKINRGPSYLRTAETRL